MICTLARTGPVYTSGRHAITRSTDRFRSALTREQTAIEPGCASADKSYGCLNVDHRLLSPRQQWQKKEKKEKKKDNLLHVCRACATRNLDAWNRFYSSWFAALGTGNRNSFAWNSADWTGNRKCDTLVDGVIVSKKKKKKGKTFLSNSGATKLDTDID